MASIKNTRLSTHLKHSMCGYVKETRKRDPRTFEKRPICMRQKTHFLVINAFEARHVRLRTRDICVCAKETRIHMKINLRDMCTYLKSTYIHSKLQTKQMINNLETTHVHKANPRLNV